VHTAYRYQLSGDTPGPIKRTDEREREREREREKEKGRRVEETKRGQGGSIKRGGRDAKI